MNSAGPPDAAPLDVAGADAPGAVEASRGDLVLRVLRVALHVAFAGLLGLAVVQMSFDPPAAAALYLGYGLSAVLAAAYLAGTVTEKRFAGTGQGPDPSRYGPAWLGVVSLLWLLLMVISSEFSWLAFPLFFLALHLLRIPAALAAVALMTGAVVAAQWAHSGGISAAAILGPVIGALFAVVMAGAYSALHSESVNQRRALAELHRTRGELAASQHDAGVLAERERLAREIHDTLAQGLSSIVLLSRAAGSALETGDPTAAKERIDLVHSTAAENLAEARRFVRGLSTGAPESGSLEHRLAALCVDAARRAAAGGSGLDCRFRVDGEPEQLPAAYEATLMRAAQSLVANVQAHAGAAHAVVTLGYSPDSVALDVVDDGAGFEPDRLPSAPRPDGTGFGLLSLRERVASLGGTLVVETAPGDGTAVSLRLPLRDPGSLNAPDSTAAASPAEEKE